MKKFYIWIVAITLAGVAAYFLEPSGWLACVCAALLLSFAIMRYATLNILTVSYRKNLYDRPDKRRVHKTPTPRLGGLAFAPILCCSVILTLSLHSLIAPEYHPAVPNCLTWICALIFIHMTGTIDDLIGVRYYVKFSAQIIAALLVLASGFWINDLHGFFGIHALHPAVGMPLTVLFIVGIINALNLIDGVDGLAAGLCIMALTVYGVLSYLIGDLFFSIIAAAAIGVLIPFFYANVRGFGAHRHKLFMGDTGSQTMGLVISVLAIGLIMNTGTELVKQNFVLALSPLLIPLFDVIHVVIFRLINGKHPFYPDMTHIHHRLLQRGFSSRRVVVLILSMAGLYTLMNVLLAPWVNLTLIFILDAVVWCAFNSVIWQLKKRKAGKERQQLFV